MYAYLSKCNKQLFYWSDYINEYYKSGRNRSVIGYTVNCQKYEETTNLTKIAKTLHFNNAVRHKIPHP